MNDDIRRQIRQAGLYQYEVAEALGLTEWTFIRWLRKRLPADKAEKVLQAIKFLAQRKG